MMGWIRFVAKDSSAPAVELTIEVHTVAADPVAWGMAIVAGNSQPTPRDQGEVQCGQPFTLEICAHDKFGHRQVLHHCCCKSGQGARRKCAASWKQITQI